MKSDEFRIEETQSKGIAFIGDKNKPQAEMTWSLAGEDLIIIDHTEVTDELKGKNIGRKLLDAVAGHVRKQGKKILPLCPFAKSIFDKDPSISDVLKG